MDDVGAKVGTWTDLVRRLRLGRKGQPLKQFALTVASYAGPHGTGIRCGVARLAADCEIAHRTARKHLATLRSLGLIELTKAGNRRRHQADEYRLTIRPEKLAGIEVPEREQYRKLVGELLEANREASKNRTLAAADLRHAMGWRR